MKDKKRVIYLTVAWLLVAACMIVIFMLSNDDAVESSSKSDGLIARIFAMFNIEVTSHFIRKLAHALEYCGLCLLLNIAYSVTYTKFCPLLSFMTAAFYATTDEIHQYFILGRACMLRDVFVDSCGALCCTAFCFIVYAIYISYKKKERLKYVSIKTL